MQAEEVRHEKEAPPIAKSRRSLRLRAIRISDAFFDIIGLRPIGILVFVASALMLVQVIGLLRHSIRAEAVALGTQVEHPSLLESFVVRVFVRPGDRVGIGAPLVELSPYFIDQELAQIDLKMERLINESKLEQARLVVDEERWIQPALRSRPSRPSLATPTEAFYAKQIEVVEGRRAALLADRDALIIRASREGVVSQVAGVGAAVPPASSVATLMPEFADEIVAFVPASTDALAITADAPAFVVAPNSSACRQAARVRRRGAAVEQAPGQLSQLLGGAVHGMPVHIDVPPDCQLGNGQTVTIDFRMSQLR